MATITVPQTDPLRVITPALVLSYGYSADSSTVVHDGIHATYPHITLRPLRSRRGTLRCLFTSQAAAADLFDAAGLLAQLRFVDVETGQDIAFVVDGTVNMSEVAGTLNWIVDLPYREVSP